MFLSHPHPEEKAAYFVLKNWGPVFRSASDIHGGVFFGGGPCFMVPFTQSVCTWHASDRHLLAGQPLHS